MPLVLLLACLAASRVRAVQAWQPLPVDAAAMEPALPDPERFLVADEQFVSGTLRGQEEVAAFLRERAPALGALTLEPVLGTKMAAAEGLAFLGEAYSVSPSLLLTLAETQHGVLSGRETTLQETEVVGWMRWTAVLLSRWFYDDYYGHSVPVVTPARGETFALNAGNPATYALRAYFFARVYSGGDPAETLSAWEQRFVRTYETYFGPAHAGRLQVRPPSSADWAALPALKLPWAAPDVWYYTGGPHNFDGSDRRPLSGVDFQPTGYPGCNPEVARNRPVVASADGLSIDYQSHWLKLDHDFDGNASTGWQTVYGHLAYRAADGLHVQQGERLGNPSCYGGFASGVHMHFGLKFENVWQPAETIVLSGWRFENGLEAYHGTMFREGEVLRYSCFEPERSSMDCAHAALTSDNRAALGNGRYEAR